MARLILKAPYYKPRAKAPAGKTRGGYANYIATREGVEILPLFLLYKKEGVFYMANKIAGIGEYIHYHAENYDRYGIARIGHSPRKGMSIEQIHRHHQKRLYKQIEQLNSLNKNQIQILEDKINDFLELLNTPASADQSGKIKQIQNELAKKIFGEGWEKELQKINWKNLSLSVDRQQQGLPQFRKGFDEYAGNWEKKVKNRIIKLNQKLQNFENTANNLKKESEVPGVIKALEETEKWLLQDLEAIDNELVANGLKAKEPKGKYPNAREYLNMLIQTYAPFISLSKMQGALFEYVVRTVANQYNNIVNGAQEEVVEYIRNMKKEKKMSNSWATENFADGMITKGNITQPHSNVYKFNNVKIIIEGTFTKQ